MREEPASAAEIGYESQFLSINAIQILSKQVGCELRVS
jgi:hypothetical protein